jgi:hypothetical protein
MQLIETKKALEIIATDEVYHHLHYNYNKQLIFNLKRTLFNLEWN